MLAATGVERLEAVIAGTVAGEIMQQAWPVQCMGAVATGRDWPQLMPMGIGMAVLLGWGQQSMVGWFPQALWPHALSAKTGWAASVRVRSRATNWSRFFMR